MKIYNEIVFDIDGNITYEDSYEYSGDVMLMQGDTDCVAQGKVQCPDGSCADHLDDCGQVYEYEADIGYTPEGEFIDDPLTTGEDEGLRDIYDALGGFEWTGKEFAEWSDDYRETFPTWTDSTYERQSELIEAQLGLLPEAMRVKEESFELKEGQQRYQTQTDLATTRQSREALIRAGGGLIKGETEEKFESAYDQVLKGFDYSVEALALEKEASMMDFESRILEYKFDLQDVIQVYQNRMWDLIEVQRDPMQCEGWTEEDGCPGVSQSDLGDADNMEVVMACEERCDDQGNPPGCKADCRSPIDGWPDNPWNIELDALVGEDDPVITKQGCIDECVDAGGDPASCRQSCIKGSDEDDSNWQEDCMADCMNETGGNKIHCLAQCGV